MLQIYTDYPQTDCIISNDFEFDTKTLKKMLSDGAEKYKSIISEIENVEFITDDKLISKINNEPISITKLSTGCKTILNILYNPDKIVFAIECGHNYSHFIYRLKDGKIYAPHFMFPVNRREFSDTEFVLHSKNEIITISGIDDLERWYCENGR